MNQWHSKPLKDLYKDLNSSDLGLSSEEASVRLTKYSFNEIQKKKKKHPFLIFLAQFQDPLVIILLIALGISISPRSVSIFILPSTLTSVPWQP